MRILAVAFLAVLLVGWSGCFGDAPSPSGDSGPSSDAAAAFAFLAATPAVLPCDRCFEPASAVDQQGRIYLAAHRVENVAVSTDGGQSFTVKPVPDPPSPTDQGSGASDDVVQVAPWGEVFYHELWSDSGGILGGGIHIAGSFDGGDTWPTNVFVSVRTMPTSRAFTADRQWLAFHGDATVYLVFNCGLSVDICLMESSDRGLTWSEARNVVLPVDHSFPSPAGFPAVGPDGTLLVPYFADPRSDGTLGARTVRVSSSSDGGRTWTPSTVFTHPVEAALTGGGWPESTILVDGTWVASWSDANDAMWVAVSHDEGANWEAGTRDSAMTGPIGGHPFLRPRQDGGFDSVWFGEKGVGAGRFDREGTLLSVALSADEGGGYSDYPFFDHDAQDRVVMPFIGPDGNGLHVAITNR